MKRLFIIFALFISVLFVFDRIAGLLLFKTFSQSQCIENYTYQKCDEDVVILGSSRAKHHYVPSIISDSLGMTCYNLGENGKNIYFQYASLLLLFQHHVPKVVIYDCFSVDVIKSDFKYDFGSLSSYYPIYGRNLDVDSLIDKQGDKYISRIQSSWVYRYNSRFLNYMSDEGNDKYQGYVPLSGVCKKGLSIHIENDNLITDESKLEYMQRLIDLCRTNGVEIIFSVSPRYALNEIDSPITLKYEKVAQLCASNEVPFLYYELAPDFLNDGNLFRDIGHLNDNGAKLFTKQFASDIKQYLLSKR